MYYFQSADTFVLGASRLSICVIGLSVFVFCVRHVWLSRKGRSRSVTGSPFWVMTMCWSLVWAGISVYTFLVPTAGQPTLFRALYGASFAWTSFGLLMVVHGLLSQIRVAGRKILEASGKVGGLL